MRHIALAVLTLAACAAWVRAEGLGEVGVPDGAAYSPHIANAPLWSFQFMTGYYPMSSIGPGPGYQAEGYAVDYFPQAFRIGCACPYVNAVDTWVEGRCEALLEYNFSHITRTFGHYFTGPCAILRYNFEQQDSLVVPYLQTGAGLVLNDAFQDDRQRLIGQAVEFLLRAEAGVHFLVTDDWSLDVEGGLQHISNACLASRNGGLNCVGFAVGFTYRFGR